MSSRPTKRFKAEAQEDSQPVTTTNEATQVVPISRINGNCGLVELPANLLLEIMSYFPAVPVPTTRTSYLPILRPSVFERWDVLRALSQTCQLWRSVFFPMLWERMEACAVRELITQRPILNGIETVAPTPSEMQRSLLFLS
jgi:hypothetical protein